MKMKVDDLVKSHNPWKRELFCELKIKPLLRLLITGMLLFSGAAFSPAAATDVLLDGATFSKQYLVEISGNVMNEKFSGAQALLSIMVPSIFDTNPYLIVIEGFPRKNSRNSFFWNSAFSEMTSIANDITCDIKRTFMKSVPMYFVFMSPDLLANTGALELYGDEGPRFAEKTALPTLVYAQAGRLKLRIHSNSVSGTIWMKGYDPVEKAYVQYSAGIHGKRSWQLEPRQQIRK